MPRYGNIDEIKQRETRVQVYRGDVAVGAIIRDLDFLEDYASPEDSHLVTGPQLERLETDIGAILNILNGCQDAEWGLCHMHSREVQTIVLAAKALLAQIREKQ
jgi:hypothetical protein